MFPRISHMRDNAQPMLVTVISGTLICVHTQCYHLRWGWVTGGEEAVTLVFFLTHREQDCIWHAGFLCHCPLWTSVVRDACRTKNILIVLLSRLASSYYSIQMPESQVSQRTHLSFQPILGLLLPFIFFSNWHRKWVNDTFKMVLVGHIKGNLIV